MLADDSSAGASIAIDIEPNTLAAGETEGASATGYSRLLYNEDDLRTKEPIRLKRHPPPTRMLQSSDTQFLRAQYTVTIVDPSTGSQSGQQSSGDSSGAQSGSHTTPTVAILLSVVSVLAVGIIVYFLYDKYCRQRKPARQEMQIVPFHTEGEMSPNSASAGSERVNVFQQGDIENNEILTPPSNRARKERAKKAKKEPLKRKEDVEIEEI
jgi:hypothetical protein